MSSKINTIVIPIVRTDYILRCLETLHKNTPPNFSVIVVDQSIPNSEWEAKVRKLCDLHIKSCKWNFGFAMASNLGIRLAPTKYVSVCNDDVEFMPLWWEGIEETFEKFPTALGVNPMSPLEPGWGWGKEGFIEHLGYKEEFSEEDVNRLKELRKGQVIDGITTWCTVFKLEELTRNVGLYDERFTPGSGEDYCLNARAYMAGYRMLSTSLSWVWHWWGRSKDALPGLKCALPQARPAWNKLGELYPKGFDVWGKIKGVKIYRVPEVARFDLESNKQEEEKRTFVWQEQQSVIPLSGQ